MRTVLLIAIFGFNTACASITRGTSAKMRVDTVPPGAVVTTDVAEIAGCPSTPCEFAVPRKAMFLMTLSHKNRQDLRLGISPSRHPTGLRSTKVGAASGAVAGGVMAGSFVASYGTIAGATFIPAGAAVGTVALSATVVGGAVLVPSLLIDSATGAHFNPVPNPISVTLPEMGTAMEVHPSVHRLDIMRMKGPEGKRARKALRRREKAARKAAKREARAL